jgi:CheY-like chemotaxis protein
MQTAGDSDKDKIQRRGKKVGTTTHAYWVVAGDELTCVTMEEVCQHWNIDKLIFTNGMQVLRWVSAVERGILEAGQAQLAILDMKLPLVGGSELSTKIKRNIHLPQMAVVLTATYPLQHDKEVEVLRSSYADALIYKPFPRPDVLLQNLQAIIARPR